MLNSTVLSARNIFEYALENTKRLTTLMVKTFPTVQLTPMTHLPNYTIPYWYSPFHMWSHFTQLPSQPQTITPEASTLSRTSPVSPLKESRSGSSLGGDLTATGSTPTPTAKSPPSSVTLVSSTPVSSTTKTLATAAAAASVFAAAAAAT
uniref:Uncharacterized protein n=1 Tax=Glossina austeni TaxID=7395 RepID=A0A1A9V4P0_GLOAU